MPPTPAWMPASGPVADGEMTAASTPVVPRSRLLPPSGLGAGGLGTGAPSAPASAAAFERCACCGARRSRPRLPRGHRRRASGGGSHRERCAGTGRRGTITAPVVAPTMPRATRDFTAGRVHRGADFGAPGRLGGVDGRELSGGAREGQPLSGSGLRTNGSDQMVLMSHSRNERDAARCSGRSRRTCTAVSGSETPVAHRRPRGGNRPSVPRGPSPVHRQQAGRGEQGGASWSTWTGSPIRRTRIGDRLGAGRPRSVAPGPRGVLGLARRVLGPGIGLP